MPTNMEKKDLLNKWLNDELTPEEFEVFRTVPEFSSYLKIDAFAKDLELPVHDIEAGLKDLTSRKGIPLVKKETKVISLSSMLRIAAILIVLLASYYFISNYTISERTDLAHTEIVTLPDNSKVSINEDSQLTV